MDIRTAKNIEKAMKIVAEIMQEEAKSNAECCKNIDENVAYDFAKFTLLNFTKDLREYAKKNWTRLQAKMLEKAIDDVLQGKK